MDFKAYAIHYRKDRLQNRGNKRKNSPVLRGYFCAGVGLCQGAVEDHGHLRPGEGGAGIQAAGIIAGENTQANKGAHGLYRIGGDLAGVAESGQVAGAAGRYGIFQL